MRTLERNGQRLGVINLTLDVDAIAILRQVAPSPRAHGRLVSRLIFEYQAKIEERQRLKEQLAAALGPEGDA
jgi:hypothetical protein